MIVDSHNGGLIISKWLLHLLIRLYSFTAIFKTIVIWTIWTDLRITPNNFEDIYGSARD